MAIDRESLSAFEQQAEYLVVSQLDLLAQLDYQVRAVHQTMRIIERLRGAKNRAGDELSNGQKVSALDDLSNEVSAIDQELHTQHQSCHEMLNTVEKMRAAIRSLRPLGGNSSALDTSGSPA